MSRKKRDRLFKRNRPNVRPFNLYDGDKYHKDMGILWASYKRKPFKEIKEGLSQQEFAQQIEELNKDAEILIIEDLNIAYDDTGPVAILWVFSDGWEYEPHVEFFSWATKRNKLSCAVSFFQWMRFKRALGLCKVESLEESMPLFKKCVDYGVLKFSGRLRNIDPRGTLYIYYIKGKNYVKQNGSTRTTEQ